MKINKKLTNVIITLLLMLSLVLSSSTVYAGSEITTDDGVIVNNDAVEEPAAEEEDDDDPDDLEDDDQEEDYDGSDAQEDDYEESDELKDGKIELSDKGIVASGYDEVSIYIYTDKLNSEDHFKIYFDGPAQLEYNETILSELGKSGCGRYDFANIEGGSFSIYATSSDKVIISYKYDEDGYPAIYIESESSDSVDGDKPDVSSSTPDADENKEDELDTSVNDEDKTETGVNEEDKPAASNTSAG